MRSTFWTRRTLRLSCPRTFKVWNSSSGRLVDIDQRWQLTLDTSLDYGFGVRHGVFSPLLGSGIFTQEGPAWKHSRELLRNQFVRTQYRNLDHFCEHVDNLLACLPSAKATIDLQPLFFKLTLDTTTTLLLGRSVHSLRAEVIADADIRAFAVSFDIAQGGLATRFRLAPWHFLYSPPHFRSACSTVHRFVDNYIQERSTRKRKDFKAQASDSFIDQLAQDTNSHQALRDQLINILLAGRDTSACCLSWTMSVTP